MGQKKHHTHLSLEERRQIYLMLGRKMSAVEIAKKLGRHHSTIYREINRNMYYEADDHKMNGYYPLTAQELYRLADIKVCSCLSAIQGLKPS